MKLIKRYANRRLYDADTSKTITLDDVAELIKTGHEVKVIDNISGDDITARVLGQTFLKISTDYYNMDFSTFLLTALIREVSGNVSSLFTQLVESGIGLGHLTAERLEKIVHSMIEHGDLEVGDRADYLDRILTQIQTGGGQIEQKVAEGTRLLRTGLSDGQDRKMDELSSRLEEMARIVQDLQKKDRPDSI